MKLAALLIGCLTAVSLAQLLPSTPEALQSLRHGSSADASAEQKAMEYLLMSYPELGSYGNATMRRIGRGSNPFALQDVYFTLYANGTRVSVIVTISRASPGEFISISPLVTTIVGSSRLGAPEWQSRANSNFYIISGDEIKVVSGGNRTERLVVPGGFQEFNSSNDVRLERAKALLASLHPQMVNYVPHQVSYQVVSGINFNIQYLGRDGLTAATALVMVNLEMEPYLVGFEVRCLATNSSAMGLECTDDLASQLFSACESFLLVHPELLAYEILSIVSEDFASEDGVLFIFTFQNAEKGFRAMAELNLSGNVFSIMSFYIYAYP